MRKPRRPNLTPIRSLTAVTHDKDAHLSLWCFDSAISLSRRDRVALCEKQEVVDERFHVFLHRCAGRRGDLVVFDPDGAGGHFVEALVDDAEGLAEFLHAAEVAVITVSVDPNWNVEFYLVVRIIGLAFAYIPRYTASSEHDAGESVVEGIGGGDDTDALSSTLPDSVIRE